MHNEDPIDYALQDADPSFGLQSLADAACDPAEALARKEEGEAEPMGDGPLVLARLLVYLHKGDLRPGEWARRWLAIARVAHPVFVAGVRARAWADECRDMDARACGAVLAIMARRVGANETVTGCQGLLGVATPLGDVWPDDRSAEWESLVVRLIEDLAGDGIAPEAVAKRASAYAQVLHHRLLCMASCAEIAALFGQVRATTSARVRRLYNERVEKAGGTAHAPFQKSAGVVEKYRDAQKGNANRKKKKF